MPLLRSIAMILFAAGLALSPAALAGQPGAEPKAQVALLVPKTTVQPGETLQVGVRFTMAPEWHIYWKNPGDSGQAPSFRWSLPGGGASRMMRGSEWSATDPQFPVPVRWVDAGGLVGYGYTGAVVFPAEVTVPASATPGQTVELGIYTQYLVCRDVCLSETGQATVELTVGAAGLDEDDDDEAARAIEAARQQLPQEQRGSGGSVKIAPQEDGSILVTATLPAGAKNPQFFPNPPEGLLVENVSMKVEGSTLHVRLSARPYAGATVEASDFEAVIGYDTNQGRRGMTVRVPVPEQAAGADGGETD